MSRTLLLIICDFLLLSLLALARFDDVIQPDIPTSAELTEAQPGYQDDLIAMLEMSLASELQTRESLAASLDRTQVELEDRSRTLELTASELEERERQARELAEQKALIEQRERQIAEEKKRVEQERAELAKRFDEARTELETVQKERIALSDNLGDLREQTATSREQLRALQQQLEERQQRLASVQQTLEQADAERQRIEQERQLLDTRLQVTETEKRMLETNLDTARQEIEVTREERRAAQEQASRLAEGVTVLAESTTQLRDEVRQSTPQSINAIFDAFQRNAVSVTVSEVSSGLFGESRNSAEVQTVLIRWQNRLYAVFFAPGTPLDPANRLRSAKELEVAVQSDRFRVRPMEAFYLRADPRLVAVQVPDGLIEKSGIEVYSIASDPFRFGEAVLVRTRNNFYGEVPFTIDAENKQYLRMDTSLFKSLFGDFTPSRGDLVFSKNGELIGVMINNRYAALVRGLEPALALGLREGFNPAVAETAQTSQRQRLERLPASLR